MFAMGQRGVLKGSYLKVNIVGYERIQLPINRLVYLLYKIFYYVLLFIREILMVRPPFKLEVYCNQKTRVACVFIMHFVHCVGLHLSLEK